MDGTRGPDLARGPDFADPWTKWTSWLALLRYDDVCRRVNCYISRVWELLISYSYTICNSSSDSDVLCQRQDSDTWHQVHRSYRWFYSTLKSYCNNTCHISKTEWWCITFGFCLALLFVFYIDLLPLLLILTVSVQPASFSWITLH